jgi:hypothetical protein
VTTSAPKDLATLSPKPLVTPRSVCAGALGFAAAASTVLFAFDPSRAEFYPPCPFHTLTGLYCPGCDGVINPVLGLYVAALRRLRRGGQEGPRELDTCSVDPVRPLGHLSLLGSEKRALLPARFISSMRETVAAEVFERTSFPQPRGGG